MMPRPSTSTSRFSDLVPVRAWALSEWALLPLRLFLGVTFSFAGLQKLADPAFFSARSATSIQSQMIGAARFSPIHSLLHAMIPHAVIIGWVIAYGELAIGIGTLLGLKTRIAAVAGAFLSLNLFLAVSFHSSPYFTGADIVFFFAWLPLIVAGGGSRLSADALIARSAAKQAGFATSPLVAMPFETVQTLCGNFQQGHCRALHLEPCSAQKCPVLHSRAPQVTPVAITTYDRRSVVIGSSTVAVVAGAAAITGFLTTSVGHLEASAVAGQKSTTSTTLPGTGSGSGTGGAKGTLLGPASSVPIGSAATFTIPTSGDPGIVFQLTKGNFVGYDAVCSHAGCTVGYTPHSQLMVCPCHGSQFQISTGQVVAGPAPHGLTPLSVVESTNGNLYLQ
jgi:thiosulfate dehydrogenase [quinone] large subunit